MVHLLCQQLLNQRYSVHNMQALLRYWAPQGCMVLIRACSGRGRGIGRHQPHRLFWGTDLNYGLQGTYGI